MTLPVLLVEDDPHKCEQISNEIRANCDATVVVAQSVSEAKHLLRSRRFQLVVLDMSLPTYSIGPSETGGNPQVFGGRELLDYLDFLEVPDPAVVITQFQRFDSGVEDMTIGSLQAELQVSHHSRLKSVIFYSVVSEAWRGALGAVLRSVK